VKKKKKSRIVVSNGLKKNYKRNQRETKNKLLKRRILLGLEHSQAMPLLMVAR
jgi:hypothetical protein